MALSDYFRTLTKQIESEARVKPLTILEFATSSSGLALKLFPAQIFIFKLFYKLPLSNDTSENEIIIRDNFNEQVLYKFSEVDFFNFLYTEGRINLSPTDWEEMEDTIDEIVFIIGRRGSKTTMTSIISAYTVYLLLLMEDPHSFFGVAHSEPIGIALCSNSSEGAERQLRNLIQMMHPCKFFQPYIYGTKGGKYWLRTPVFKEKEDLGITTSPGNLLIEAYAASPSVRGASNIIVVMDEYGHFNDAEVTAKKKPLDIKLYEALTPSVAGFTDNEGKAYGKSFVMSSPNGKKGELYKMFQEGKKNKDVYLVINMPSHWVNNSIAPKRLRNAFNKSELSFRQEYLGEFVDNVNGWISNPAKVRAIVNKLWTNSIDNGDRNKKYYLGLDLAMSGDGFALCVAHKELKRPIGEYEEEGYELLLNYGETYVIDYMAVYTPANGEVLDHEFIISTIKNLYGKFNIVRGVYDQWAGQIFTQLFKKARIPRLEMKPSTQAVNSETAKQFRQLLMEGKIMAPDYEPLITELLNLQETTSRNGYVKVEALSGGHDDLFDAVSRAIYLTYEMSDSNPYISGVVGGTNGKVDLHGKSLSDIAKMKLLLENRNKENGTVYGGAITR